MANKKWTKEDVLRYAQELKSPFEAQTPRRGAMPVIPESVKASFKARAKNRPPQIQGK